MRFTLKGKMVIGFLVILALMTIASFISLNRLSIINNHLRTIIEQSSGRLRLTMHINHDVLAISKAVNNVIIAHTIEEVDTHTKSIEKTETQIKRRIQKLRHLTCEEGKRILDEFIGVWDNYIDISKEVIKLSRTNSNVKAKALSQGEARIIFDQAVSSLSRIMDKNENKKDIAEKMKLCAQIRSDLWKIERGEKKLLLAHTETEMDKYIISIDDLISDLEIRLTSLSELIGNDDRGEFVTFHNNFKKYMKLHTKVQTLSKENTNAKALELAIGKGQEKKNEAIKLIEALVEDNDNDMHKDEQLSNKNYAETKGIIFLSMLLSLAVTIIIAIWIIKGLLKRVLCISNYAKQIASRSFPEKCPLGNSKDELTPIIASLNETAKSYKEVIFIADQISKGNYLNKVEPLSEDDKLGNALKNMTERLKKISEIAQSISKGDLTVSLEVKHREDFLGKSINKMASSLRNSKDEFQKRAWVTNGQTQLNDLLQQESSLTALSKLIIDFLARYLNAQRAALYLVENNTIVLANGFALSQGDTMCTHLKFGEGLIGQVAQEKKSLEIVDIPDDYFPMETSLGKCRIKALYIVPFFLEERIIGVLEFGMLQSLSDIKKEWINSITYSIAVTFDRVKSHNQLKNALTQLRMQSRELDRSNTELEHFASAASHDLQEPLRKVITFGDLLNEEYGDKIPNEGKEYLNGMQMATARMGRLIEGLLQYSRIAKEAAPFEAIDLNDVVAEASAPFEFLITKKQAMINLGQLPQLQGDRLQMILLFQNLMSNALKYCHKDRKPSITIFSTTLDNGMAEIVIEDNGIGFEEKFAERIFLPFQRLHERDKYEGTGIGLTICQRIVDRHGGKISVHSRPGRGSSFIVKLPLMQNKQEVMTRKNEEQQSFIACR